MQRPPFANGSYYHVFNRGVLKQQIFFEKADYLRFLRDIQTFMYFEDRGPTLGGPTSKKPLVSVAAWCLMPNHFHLLLQQQSDGGVSEFMKRLGVGFTGFINKKYKRSGHAFQGKYKVKLIDKDSYFFHISRYIHLNPTDLMGSEDQAANKPEEIMAFLERYPWSSYRDWIGKKNFPSILDFELIRQFAAGPEEYRVFVRDWLPHRGPTSGGPTSGGWTSSVDWS